MSSNRQVLLIVTALCVCLALAYLPLPFGTFIQLDTDFYVLSNEYVSTGLSRKNLLWSLTSFYLANWHPLTWMSHQLDASLFGLNPAGHLIHNLLLHLVNTLLLFFLLKRMTRSLLASAMTALVFAIHPLNVEVVAWIAQRKSLLSTAFGLLSLWFYVDYSERRQWRSYVASLLSFLLGLAAKPMLVTLPFLLLLLDIWPLKRVNSADLALSSQKFKHLLISHARLLLEKLPFFIASIATCWVTVLAQGRSGAIATLQQLSLPTRLANAIITYAVYLRDLFLPNNLGLLYPHPYQLRPLWQIVTATILLVSVSLFVLRQTTKRPLWFTGWFWYVGTLVPVIGLVQVGEMTHADRYCYIPMIGALLCLFFGIQAAQPSRNIKRILGIAFTLWVIFLVAKTHKQVRYWDDTVTLYEHTLAITGPNPLLENNLGAVYYLNNQAEKALPHLRRALAIRPNRTSVHRNLGLTLSQLGRYEEALIHFGKALESDPSKVPIRVDMGKALLLLGRKEEGIALLKEALRRDPSNESAYVNLSRAYGKGDATVSFLQEAVEHLPKSGELQMELGNNLRILGRDGTALPHLLKAISLAPELWNSHYFLGLCYQKLRNADAARQHFEAEIALNPGHVKSYFQLAQHYEGMGRFGASRPLLEKVLQLKPNHQRASFLFAQHLYREGQAAQALPYLERVLAKKPKQVQSLYLSGVIHSVLGDSEKAEAALEKAKAVDPKWVETYIALGDHYQRKGQSELAKEQYIAGLKKASEQATLHNKLALLQLAQASFEAALTSAREAYRLEPRNYDYIYTLARALKEVGDLTRARKAIQSALELARNSGIKGKSIQEMEQLQEDLRD